eukprot:10104212-Alexandrium_andersonii.AAC.1
MNGRRLPSAKARAHTRVPSPCASEHARAQRAEPDAQSALSRGTERIHGARQKCARVRALSAHPAGR